MPEQEPSASEANPSEETTSDAEGATPPLNREQRRAQAKGKKGGAGINPSLTNTQNMRGPGVRGGTPGAASRFQRKTGGK